MKILKNSIMVLLLIILLACNREKIRDEQNQTKISTPEKITDNDSLKLGIKNKIDGQKQDTSLAFFTKRVIKAIAEKDFNKLSNYISNKGLRFSPYKHIENGNILFMPDNLRNGFSNDSVLVWGIQDGSGEPIEYSFKAYYKHFVYDVNFDSLSPNFKAFKSSGNSLDNIKSFYPNSFVVEYYFEGTKASEHMDWRALFLIFEKSEKDYKLVGIAHGQWTI